MRLADFFARVGPYLEGQAALDETLTALHGTAAANADARRLAIYGRFCRIHRFNAIGLIYTATREVVLARGGEGAWSALVECYFRAHPMHHTELNENGAAFAEFLAGERATPPWLSEIADFEWWEWRTRMAPDDPADAEPDAGPTRLASTVELRPYHVDVVGFVDEEAWAAEPRPADALLLFWRDCDLGSRAEPATPIEMALLKEVIEGRAIAAPPAAIPVDAWAATEADLRAAGVVLGAR